LEQSASARSFAFVRAGRFLFGFLVLSFIFKIKTRQRLPGGGNSISPPSAILNRYVPPEHESILQIRNVDFYLIFSLDN